MVGRSSCHCERSEAIFARKQRLLRRLWLLAMTCSSTFAQWSCLSVLREGVTMKKLLMIVLAGWSFALSPGIQTVAAHQGYTPLEDLAGTYALTFQGSYALC